MEKTWIITELKLKYKKQLRTVSQGQSPFLSWGRLPKQKKMSCSLHGLDGTGKQVRAKNVSIACKTWIPDSDTLSVEINHKRLPNNCVYPI